MNNSLAPAAASRSRNSTTGSLARILAGTWARTRSSISIMARRNRINPATCPVASCGGTGLQQTFGMTVNWHLRPTGRAGREFDARESREILQIVGWHSVPEDFCMYKKFFGLKENPFNVNPDPRYLFLTGTHAGSAGLLDLWN